jgi:hypothetical protein
MSNTTAVRTTLRPHEVIEVGDAELIDLERQGLIDSKHGDKGWKPATSSSKVATDSGVITDGVAGSEA